MIGASCTNLRASLTTCMVVIELSLHLGFLGSISMATSSTEFIMLLKVVSISSSGSERDSNRFLTVQDKVEGRVLLGNTFFQLLVIETVQTTIMSLI